MPKGRSPLAIIFITVLIDLIGFGIVIPVLPLYADRFGASAAVIGMLLGVYSAMTLVFSPVLGHVSDRVGRRPVLLFSIIGSSIGFLVMGFAHALWLLFLGRIIDGISGGNISTAQAYIADVTPPEERSKRMGLLGAAFGLGFVIGPALGGWMSRISPEAPFFLAAAMAAANAIALFFVLPESLSEEHRSKASARPSMTRLFEEQGSWQLTAVLLTIFIATVAFALLTTIYTLFTWHRFELDATHNGNILAYMGIIGAVIQGGLLGRLVRVAGDRRLAVIGTVLLAASLFAFPLTSSVLTLLLATSGMAIGNSLATPTLNGLASKCVGPQWQGRVFGVTQSVSSLARIVGPVLGGWLLSRDDAVARVGSYLYPYGRTPFWTGGFIMIVAFMVSLTIGYARELSPKAVAEGD